MKRILSIILLFPLALNAMEGANPKHFVLDSDIELSTSMTPEIVDNNDVPLPWRRNPYVFGNYQVETENWIDNPTTRMNSIGYSVKKVDENKVLTSGIALAAFNTIFRHRLNEEAQLKITFINNK
jgi:hypothetical protein